MKYAIILCFILIKYAVGDIVNTLRNHAAMSVSHECSEALNLFMKNLMQPLQDDSWAIKMLDASSKIPSGLLSYNFGEMGDFEECLATESLDHSVQARYCLGALPFSRLDEFSSHGNLSDLETIMEQMNFRTSVNRLINLPALKDSGNDNAISSMITGPSWAVCLPEVCSEADVNDIFSVLPLKFHCQTRKDLDPSLTIGASLTIAFFVIIISIMIASTVYDLNCNLNKVSPRPLLITFSLQTNGRKLFQMETSKSPEFSCISGIRVISMIWVIFGHTFLSSLIGPTTNLKALLEWSKQLYSMIVISGTLAVDTFFLIGGVLLAYGFMKMKHNGIKFNIIQYYIHRYVRLTPPLAAIILVSATLSPYLGSGPRWSSIKFYLENACRENWWTALLYTQNYYLDSSASICIGQSWYLDVDMQLFILSPLILLPLHYYPMIGLCLLFGYIGATIISNFCIAYINDLSAIITAQVLTPTIGGGDMMSIFYMKTHTRATPWLIGILLGYYVSLLAFKNQKIPRLGRKTVALAWAVCLAVILTCVFGGQTTLMGPDYDRWGNSLHIAFVRPAWALCFAWIILACYLDYGGPINTLLSLPIFQVLSRFTYSIYLVHLNLVYYRSFSYKTGIHFSFYDITCQFWSFLMYSFGLSVFWSLAFESPFIALEKIILR